jgi:primosomal protein N' (replication factor Y)
VTDHQQLTLVRERLRRVPPPEPTGPAATRPVARVLVDVALPHLDRPFDYLVRSDQDDSCVPGCRVKVRFAGKDVDGFVLERAARSDHDGPLASLRRVVSAQVVLTPAVARLCREVARRYAGSTSDLLRLAVPRRHARVEAEARQAALATPPRFADDAGGWAGVAGGEQFLRSLRQGGFPRVVWTAEPGGSWTSMLVRAVAATVAGGRGALICVPDTRDVQHVAEAFTAAGWGEQVAVLTADLGPAARYRAFLRVLRGQAPVVVGTRAAAWAPVQRLGLAVVWDDGDDLHAELRAPYPHVREVLAIRAHAERCAMLLGGHARTAEGAALVESGWAVTLQPSRAAVRRAAPRVHLTGESLSDQAGDPAARRARLPHRAFEVARAGLERGPVLVQVPRRGYLPALACRRCRQAARCTACTGPLARGPGRSVADCAWCGRPAEGWRCRHCSSGAFRAPVVGSERTAEELGRAFPSVPVISSSSGRVQQTVGPRPALVVCTPGAEPLAEGGYAAALLLDTWLMLSRPGLRTPEEALRRWLNAATLVRPAGDGGRVLVVGDPALPVLQALVRWDPVGFAARELADRASAHLPPAARIALVTGPADQVGSVGGSLALPPGAEILGPTPVDDESARLIVRVPRDRGPELSAEISRLQATRSARKLPHLRVQIDPVELG